MPTELERLSAARQFLGAISAAVLMVGLKKTAFEIDRVVTELAGVEADLRAKENRTTELLNATKRRAAANRPW